MTTASPDPAALAAERDRIRAAHLRPAGERELVFGARKARLRAGKIGRHPFQSLRREFVGECPMVPMFHSPTANHALRRARFAGWKDRVPVQQLSIGGLVHEGPQPATAVQQVSVSRRSSLIDSSRWQLLHGSRGDRALELPLEDGVDDQDGDDGDHDGGEQPAEVDVVAGL